MVRQSHRVDQNIDTPPSYQRVSDVADPIHNMALPSHERDLLIPPSSSGQPVVRSYSDLPQSSSKSGTKRSYMTFVCTFFLMGVCMIIGANIQRAVSTSIFDPAVRDQIRREWEITYANHERRMDKMQEAWEVEAERYSQFQLEIMNERKQWDAERQARERVDEEERMEEVERRRRERQREIEEEERKQAGLRWEELHKSDRCLRYGTRKYWAKLQVPEGYNTLKGCRETEIQIHGRKLLPTDCDDQGKWGGVWGNWIVDFNEASCGTYWSEFYDEGCTAGGSGLRRIHARLYNYNAADDWNEMCSSTPVKFNGLNFDAPMSCTSYGNDGIYGFWDVDDGACR